MATGERKHACPFCSRRFPDQNAVYQHARSKHPREKVSKLRPKRDDEPSIADLMVEATWNDDPDLDWVRDMMS